MWKETILLCQTQLSLSHGQSTREVMEVKKEENVGVTSEDSWPFKRAKWGGMVYGLVIRVRFQQQLLRLIGRGENLAPGRCSNFFALSDNVGSVSLSRTLVCLVPPYPCNTTVLET